MFGKATNLLDLKSGVETTALFSLTLSNRQCLTYSSDLAAVQAHASLNIQLHWVTDCLLCWGLDEKHE